MWSRMRDGGDDRKSKFEDNRWNPNRHVGLSGDFNLSSTSSSASVWARAGAGAGSGAGAGAGAWVGSPGASMPWTLPPPPPPPLPSQFLPPYVGGPWLGAVGMEQSLHQGQSHRIPLQPQQQQQQQVGWTATNPGHTSMWASSAPWLQTPEFLGSGGMEQSLRQGQSHRIPLQPQQQQVGSTATNPGHTSTWASSAPWLQTPEFLGSRGSGSSSSHQTPGMGSHCAQPPPPPEANIQRVPQFSACASPADPGVMPPFTSPLPPHLFHSFAQQPSAPPPQVPFNMSMETGFHPHQQPQPVTAQTPWVMDLLQQPPPSPSPSHPQVPVSVPMGMGNHPHQELQPTAAQASHATDGKEENCDEEEGEENYEEDEEDYVDYEEETEEQRRARYDRIKLFLRRNLYDALVEAYKLGRGPEALASATSAYFAARRALPLFMSSYSA